MTNIKAGSSGAVLLCAVTYFVSYITRTNYGAIISEMVAATGYTKSMLSLALTGSFITYGAGMIVSGFLGDRIAPKKMVTAGLAGASLMNLLILLCADPWQMFIVWCCNGFCQSLLWPPIVRILTAVQTPEEYKASVVKMTWGSSCGTIAVYLIAPLLISWFSWKAVFLVSAVCGISMIGLWNRFCPSVSVQKREKVQYKGGSVFSTTVIVIMVAIVLHGMLRDGVTTWMPSYISETYNLSSVISILTGVVLPIFGIVCSQVTSLLYRKTFTNPMVCAGVIFGVGALAALGLVFCTGKSAALSVILSAVLDACMHGVNLIMTCMLPPILAKDGNISLISGTLNSCTYVGSAISIYGIAALTEGFGWGLTVLLWFLVAVAGTVLCLVCGKPMGKKT